MVRPFKEFQQVANKAKLQFQGCPSSRWSVAGSVQMNAIRLIVCRVASQGRSSAEAAYAYQYRESIEPTPQSGAILARISAVAANSCNVTCQRNVAMWSRTRSAERARKPGRHCHRQQGKQAEADKKMSAALAGRISPARQACAEKSAVCWVIAVNPTAEKKHQGERAPASHVIFSLVEAPPHPTMPLLEGLVNGVDGEGGLPALLLDNLFVTVPLLLTLAVLFFLRPRKAGSKYKDAPPMVTKSTVSSVPLLGPAIEFGKSPVKMVKRCYDDYGPVFTVPVRAAADLCPMLGSRMRCICFVLLFAPGPVEHCSFAFDILSGTDI